jgi:hypothetical protein
VSPDLNRADDTVELVTRFLIPVGGHPDPATLGRCATGRDRLEEESAEGGVVPARRVSRSCTWPDRSHVRYSPPANPDTARVSSTAPVAASDPTYPADVPAAGGGETGGGLTGGWTR